MILRPNFSILCEAINSRHLLSFTYNGKPRLAIPCAHGILTSGNEALRAHQIYESHQRRIEGIGKLYLVEKIIDPVLSDDEFLENPIGYKSGDSAMAEIHCQL